MHNSTTILNELTQILGKPIYWPTVLPYTLPINYFNTNTLKLIKPILRSTQAIPKNYFEALPQIIIARINNAENSVPKNYFENFSSSLMQKIKASENIDDLNNVAPTLAQIGKQNIYQVPNNYFNQTKFIPKPKGTLLTITKKWLKPMVAAMVIISCSSVGYFAWQAKTITQRSVAIAPLILPVVLPNKLPIVIEQAISDNFINAPALKNIELALNQINEDELYAYVNNHAIGANFAEPIITNTPHIADISNVNTLDNLSDAEMEQYLNDNIN